MISKNGWRARFVFETRGGFLFDVSFLLFYLFEGFLCFLIFFLFFKEKWWILWKARKKFNETLIYFDFGKIQKFTWIFQIFMKIKWNLMIYTILKVFCFVIGFDWIWVFSLGLSLFVSCFCSLFVQWQCTYTKMCLKYIFRMKIIHEM